MRKFKTVFTVLLLAGEAVLAIIALFSHHWLIMVNSVCFSVMFALWYFESRRADYWYDRAMSWRKRALTWMFRRTAGDPR